MAPTTRTIAFAPIYTASAWATIAAAVAKAAHDSRGDVTYDDVTRPRLLNRDVIALVDAWRRAARQRLGLWPIWFQYAAAAYNWQQPGDGLVVDDDQAAQVFASDYTVSLWDSLDELATRLDDEGVPHPALSVVDAWGDPTTIADVHAALVADTGAGAYFKHPIPVCKDKRTGEKRLPRPKRDPKTGKWSDPDCEIVTVDDPVSALVKWLLRKGAGPALVVGGLYLGARLFARPRRRAATRRRRKGRSHGHASRSRALLG